MDKERILARGIFEELKDRHKAVLLEIRSLIQDMNRKMPMPDLNSKDALSIDICAAQSLLNRIKGLQTKMSNLHGKICSICERWGFPW